MKKRKLKTIPKIIICLILVLFGIFLVYKLETGPVNKKAGTINFTVEQGDTYSTIAHTLKENKLIKSELFYRIYLKFHNPKKLQVGTYELSGSMSVGEIVKKLEKNPKSNDVIVTFKEGINFINIISLLTENFGFTEEEIELKLKDTNYLNNLIAKYWFLTDAIKDENIYYSLEGYLFPDTYHFKKGSNLEDIFETMLDNTSIKLKKYENDLLNNKYSIHEMITMASIIEMEASNSDDRKGVAGVFYNRLESGWSLGSDVTTYYGLKLPLSERDLTQAEIGESNSYNTRSSSMAGKLPVGPIALPSLESLEAAIYPENHNYYYFVADKNGKTYFSKTANEHDSTINKLKSEGLWYQY